MRGNYEFIIRRLSGFLVAIRVRGVLEDQWESDWPVDSDILIARCENIYDG